MYEGIARQGLRLSIAERLSATRLHVYMAAVSCYQFYNTSLSTDFQKPTSVNLGSSK